MSTQLKTGSIGTLGAVAMCMAFMGPATSIAFNTQPAVGGAGLNLPLSMTMALVACLLVANTIAGFARKMPTAGFAFTFNTRAFGPTGGMLSGWFLLLGYAMVTPMLFSAIGEFTSEFIDSLTGVSIPWWILSIAYAAVVWFINSRGIAESARAALVFLVVEVGVLLALFVTVLGKGGAEGLTAAPFNPMAGGVGISGLGVGMLWGILYFIGFESAATLGEEAKNPRRTIPRALFAGVIILGVFYVLACYAIVVGFGPHHIGDLAANSSPLTALGQKFWGITWIVALTILASQFANTVAGASAAVRIVFALGRDRILPAAFGRTDRRGIPQLALACYLGFSLLLVLVLGPFIGPLGVYGFAGTMLGVVMVVVYISMNVALTRLYWRDYRSEFSVWRHGVLPVISSLVMLLPLYGQLYPAPAMPNALVPYLALVWLAIGVIYVLALRRKDPVRLTKLAARESIAAHPEPESERPDALDLA